MCFLCAYVMLSSWASPFFHPPHVRRAYPGYFVLLLYNVRHKAVIAAKNENFSKKFGMRRSASQKRRCMLFSDFHCSGAGPRGIGASGVFGVAVGSDVVSFSGGTLVCHIGDNGGPVFGNQVRIVSPFEGKHRLVAAAGLLFIDNDLGGTYFLHGVGGRDIELDAYFPVSSSGSGNLCAIKIVAGSCAGGDG